MKNLITLLCLCLTLNLVLGCIDGEEVELWGECYNIEWTTHLFLSGNQLNGEIPSEIGQLINLEHLYLFNNQLTGEIPSEIGELINLVNLQLFNNQLTGEIPESIGSLINLENLQLFNNQLTGEIPESIGSLINLNDLVLYNNQLIGEIPSEIGNLFNVNYLYLNDNQLTGEIPFEICNIGDPIPSLFNNQLCPPYPDCISQSNIDSFDTSECGELSNSDDIIEYSLNKPYPNPFNPITTISFSIPNYDFVSIKVYDINGRLLSILVENHFSQGRHSLTWDGTDFSSGQYLIKIESGSFSKIQIVSLIK